VIRTFQFARRLTPTVWVASFLLVVSGCAAGKAIEGSLDAQPPEYVALHLSPPSVTLNPTGTADFQATAELSDGSENPATGAILEATGGTISGSGHYVAGPTAGLYRVIATLVGRSDTSQVTISSNPPRTLSEIAITPAAAVLLPNAIQQFDAVGVLSDGSDSVVAVNWSATGGTVSGSGLYTAPAQTGNFLVVAALQGGTLSDTVHVTVTVTPPTLTAVVLNPATAALQFGQVRQFTASGLLIDGSSASIAVTWTATGGTVSSSGRYTAGNTAGAFRVIARAANGLADTSSITLSAPTITRLTLSPATASLQGGQAQQFSVLATLSNGGSQTNPTVTYTATGGTITTGGLYTAGVAAGSFRVIAVAAGGAADTSTVSVTSATVTAIVVAPASVSLAPGELIQFSTSAVLSNGGTQANPAVTWSATGGTITTGGLYTASGAMGSFRVIAAQQGGALADTADVSIAVAGTGPYANRPANYTKIISDYAFSEALPGNDQDQPFGTGGWSMIGGSQITRVNDPTAPTSPPEALQWQFDPGPGGTSVGNVYRVLDRSVSQIYVAFALWHDPNFEWNTISNKLFYWEDGNTILQSRHNDDFLSLYIGAYDRVFDPNAYHPVISDFNGRWVNIEYIIKRGNPGLLKVWMNGKLVADHAVQVPMISSWSEVSINSTWGGGGTRTRTSFGRGDHILIATP